MNARLKGAFAGCTWCGGNGCLCCDDERRKAEERAFQPIFTADRNNPADMQLFREYFGAEALQKAFGPGGGGMAEIHENALIATVRQTLRKACEAP